MFDESRLKTCKWWSTFSRLYCSQSLVWYRWVLAASSGNTRAQASVLTWKSVCIMCIEYELGLLCTKCTSSRLAASQSQRSLILPFYSWKKKPRSLKLRLVHSEFRGVDETHLNKSYQVYASAGSRNSNQLNGCSASKKRGAHLSHLKFQQNWAKKHRKNGTILTLSGTSLRPLCKHLQI